MPDEVFVYMATVPFEKGSDGRPLMVIDGYKAKASTDAAKKLWVRGHVRCGRGSGCRGEPGRSRSHDSPCTAGEVQAPEEGPGGCWRRGRGGAGEPACRGPGWAQGIL